MYKNICHSQVIFRNDLFIGSYPFMKQLPQILKALMLEQTLSVSELARRTGVGQPVIHRMLSAETDNPKVATLSPIANYFAISISQLIGDERLPHNRIPGTFQLSAHGWTTIPLLNWEQVIHWPTKMATITAKTTVPTEVNVSQKAFALRVKDTTMLPRFPENTLLIIDPDQQATDRDFVIVHLSGQKQAIFRQVLFDGDNIYLKPLNPDFQIQLSDKKSQIIGVMVQARMDFKN